MIWDEISMLFMGESIKKKGLKGVYKDRTYYEEFINYSWTKYWSFTVTLSILGVGCQNRKFFWGKMKYC